MSAEENGTLRKKTKYTGVYSVQSPKRRHAGRPDIAYDITYKVGKSKYWERVGWKSEGISAGFASQVRAEKLLEARRSGAVKRLAPLTFDEAFEKYRVNHLVNTKSEKRIVSMYEAAVKKKFGKLYLHQIKTFEIQQFVAKLAGKRAPATIRHYITIIRTVYNKMIAWGEYAGPVPTVGVEIPTVDNQRDRFLTHEEAKKLLTELRRRSEDTYRIALLSLNTGMRAGEIFHLKGEDVDLTKGVIRIRDPKNGKARVAYMSEAVCGMFGEMEIETGEYVFPSRGGGLRRWVPATFDRAVIELGFNEGLEDSRDRIVFHSLRHTFAAWLATEGVPLYTISKLLGHSTIKMTERYAKLMPEAKRQAVDILNSIVKLD